VRTCAECEANIQLYIDGELTGEECEDFLSHVGKCVQCSQALKEAEALSLRVRSARPSVTAPNSLRVAVMRAIQNAERTRIEPGVTAKQTTPISAWSAAAIAAVLTLGVGSVFMYQRHQQNEAGALLKTAAFTYQELKRNALPLDIATDSSEKLATWFQSRVSFPFHMANSGIASDMTAQYKLIGGRLLIVDNEPLAMVVFSLSDDVVTMLVGPEHLMKASGGTVIQSAGIALHSRNEGSLHLVTWNNRGLIYVLASTPSMGNSQQCSSCHRDSATTSAAVRISRLNGFRLPSPPVLVVSP
jgi:anti-sigma factor RsiW